jgi:hypothetical protein
MTRCSLGDIDFLFLTLAKLCAFSRRSHCRFIRNTFWENCGEEEESDKKAQRSGVNMKGITIIAMKSDCHATCLLIKVN